MASRAWAPGPRAREPKRTTKRMLLRPAMSGPRPYCWNQSVAAQAKPQAAPLRRLQLFEFTEKLERARRIERPTLTLARLCSTPELRPHSKRAGYDRFPRGIQAAISEVSVAPEPAIAQQSPRAEKG